MPHPELASEQAYVDAAHARLAERACEAAALADESVAADGRAAAALLRAQKATDVASGQPLVFGRIDDATGDVAYVGRQSVLAPDGTPLVMSWKAKAAAPFYQADAEDPMGLQLRRRMLADRQTLIDLRDEWFDDMAKALASGKYEIKDPPVLGQDALLLDLEARRDGEMRDIVATIQAEQDRAIRAPADGVLVIQGGPGTGKSAVGLHRAAFLLFDREDLRAGGVLVIGPNTAFMRYIQRVLPSLGEVDVAQSAITRLGMVAEVRAEDTRKTVAIKGSAAMAEVLHRAVWARLRPQELDLALPGVRVRFGLSTIQDLVEQHRSATTYDAGRRAFEAALLAAVAQSYAEQIRSTTGLAPAGADEAALRGHEQFERALERVWPRLGAREVLRELLSTRAQLTAAGDGLLEADQQALLLRTRARNMDSEPWTLHDLPLLHELESLLRGSQEQYAHVVVDEAQDLSPMQLRMVGRHCSGSSFTLLGDLAQATGPWSARDWDDIASQLRPGEAARLAELTIGYRVPTEIMAFAARLLPFTAPDLSVPSSVRSWEPPTLLPTSDTDLMARAADEAIRFAEEGRTCAIIVPDQYEAQAVSLLRERAVTFGNARQDDLTHDITLLPASIAKGLEFEGVVLVEPAAFKAWGEDGLRWLYVALTRTTQGLRIVHSKPLPPELGEAPRMRPQAAPVAIPTLQVVGTQQDHNVPVLDVTDPREAPKDEGVPELALPPQASKTTGPALETSTAPLLHGLDDADVALLDAVAGWLRAQHR